MKRRWLPALCLCLSLLFGTLGHWQVQRLAWKNALIERVLRNTVAEPVILKGSASLNALEAASDEYHRVRFDGQPDCRNAVPVWAATSLGTGYWWMVPVYLADGSALWVNRGYVTADAVAQWRNQALGQLPGQLHGQVPAQSLGQLPNQFIRQNGSKQTADCPSLSLEGLLRTTQTAGGFLRKNDPATGRWYSRDVSALSNSLGLNNANLQWFVDAFPSAAQQGVGPDEAGRSTAPIPDGSSVQAPVPGLTPLQWPNRHLGYALTWFGLALAGLAGAVLSWRAKV